MEELKEKTKIIKKQDETKKTTKKQDGIKKIMERSTVESIATYIETGGELQKAKNKCIAKRKEKAYDQLNIIMETYVDKRFHDEINKYIAELINVNFSIGMKAGAKLTTNLLLEK